MDPVQQAMTRALVNRARSGGYMRGEDIESVRGFIGDELADKLQGERADRGGFGEVFQGSQMQRAQQSTQGAQADTQKQIEQVQQQIAELVNQQVDTLMRAFQEGMGPLGELAGALLGKVRAQSELMRQQMLEAQANQKAANN
jgi:hypothetical protein